MSAIKRDNPNQSPKTQKLDLFTAIQDKSIKVKELSRSWHALYTSSPSSAFNSIFYLLLNSCAIPIHSESFESALSSKGKFFKYLISHSKELTSFPLQALIRNSRIKVYQDYFKYLAVQSGDQPEILGKMVQWLIECSGFTIRTVRQATIWIFSGLLFGFIELQNKIQAKLDSLNEASTSSARVEGFIKEKKELNTKSEFLSNIIKDILNNVVLIRCKDVLADIRITVVQILEWLIGTNYDEEVVETLRQLSNDSKSEIRLRVLKAFTKLKSEDLLDLKTRIFESCFDFDDKCCVAALKLCQNPIFDFSDNEKAQLQKLIWSENKDIRNIAMDFVILTHFGDRLPQGTSDAVGVGLDQCKVLSIEKALLALIAFFKKQSPELYLSESFIETLWNKTSAVRSCDVMCDLLSRGYSTRSSSSSLGNSEKIVLVLFIQSILSFLSKDVKNKDKLVKTSSLLFLKLPELLTYYRKENEIMGYLVKILPLLDLNSLALNDLKHNFLEVLQQLSEIFTSNSDLEVLKYISKALVRYAKGNHPLKKEAGNELTKVIEYTTKGNFKNLLPQISALLMEKDIIDELDGKIVKVCEKNLIQNPETVLNLLFYLHLWSFSKVVIGKLPENEYFSIRGTTINSFLLVMKETAYHKSSFSALKYLCETFYFISDTVKGQFFYSIPEKISLDIEKFMIYSYLPESDQEDSKDAETTCIFISRIIANCTQVISSHLASSFIAFYGRSCLLRISTVVKQILNLFKTQDLNKVGPFSDPKLIFAIGFQAIMKVICKGELKDIENMKELCKKLLVYLPPDKFSKDSGRFHKFITEIVDFSFTDPCNFPILESLTVFVNKNTLDIDKIRDIYEHVRYYADNFSREREPLYTVMSHLKRIVSIPKESVVNKESENEEFLAPKSIQKTKKIIESAKKTSESKKRTRDSYINEQEGIEEPYGKTRKSTLRRKVK